MRAFYFDPSRASNGASTIFMDLCALDCKKTPSRTRHSGNLYMAAFLRFVDAPLLARLGSKQNASAMITEALMELG